MATQREIQIKLSAQDAGATSIIGRVTGAVESLKRVAGGRSDAKDILEILRGGGPIAAIGFGAAMFRDVAAGAKQLAVELAKGTLSARELPERLVSSVPIISSIYQGIKDVALVVTGIAQDQAKWSQDLENVETLSKTIKGNFQAAAAFAAGIARRQFNESASPEAKAAAQLEDDASAAKSKIKSENDPQRAKLKKDLAQAQEDADAARLRYEAASNTEYPIGPGEMNAAAARVQSLQDELAQLQKSEAESVVKIEKAKERELTRLRQQSADKQSQDARKAADAQAAAVEQGYQRLGQLQTQYESAQAESEGRVLDAALMRIYAQRDARIAAIEEQKKAADGAGKYFLDQEERWLRLQAEVDADAARKQDAEQRQREADQQQKEEAQSKLDALREQRDTLLENERTRNRQDARIRFAPAEESRFGTGGVDLMKERLQSDYSAEASKQSQKAVDQLQKLNDQIRDLVQIVRDNANATPVLIN
jgi:hypothetical protein